jgi:hypothetical protein
MASDLDIDIVFEKKVTVKENGNNEDTERLKEVQRIFKNVGIRVFQPPFQDGAYSIINCIPETKQQICPFPYTRYVVYKLQASEIVEKPVKLKNKFSE